MKTRAYLRLLRSLQVFYACQSQTVSAVNVTITKPPGFPVVEVNADTWFSCNLSEPAPIHSLVWWIPNFSGEPGLHCNGSLFRDCVLTSYGCSDCFRSPGREISTDNPLYGRITIRCQPDQGYMISSCSMHIHQFQPQDSGFYGCYTLSSALGAQVLYFTTQGFLDSNSDCPICGIQGLTYDTCHKSIQGLSTGTIYRCNCKKPYWGYLCRYRNDTSGVQPSTPTTNYPIPKREPPYYIMEPATTILVACATMFLFGLLGPLLSLTEHWRRIPYTIDDNVED